MNKNDKARVKEIPFEDVVILPPKPGVCQICAVDHEPDQPHNRDSLYYQMKFRQQHGRFPTWADAMAHCDEHVKKLLTELERMRAYGLPPLRSVA